MKEKQPKVWVLVAILNDRTDDVLGVYASADSAMNAATLDERYYRHSSPVTSETDWKEHEGGWFARLITLANGHGLEYVVTPYEVQP